MIPNLIGGEVDVSGRTNHWGRISLRFGPNDFKRKSIDGLGDNWPINYEDVKPYYDKVDKLIGITGTKETFIMNQMVFSYLLLSQDFTNCTIRKGLKKQV